MTAREGRSAAARVFVAVALAALLVTVLLAVLLVLDAQRAERAEAETVTRAAAVALAADPTVAAAVDSDDATALLQPVAEQVMARAPVDFVSILTPAGVRVTHRDPAQIGGTYLGTVPVSPATMTEEFTGTLGPSVRTITPIEDGDILVGWVSVGVTVDSIAGGIVPRLPYAFAIAAAVLAAGLIGAALARLSTRRVAGDLPAGSIRDTLSSYESMRTLGEALRAQTHEHGNRMHTAVALIELGRTDEAVELLTAASQQSQDLVDQVTAREDGDPTLGALLLGKASQAAERGIRWEAEIAADAPQSTLAPIDQVALLGNLIDNALDAAAAAAPPRWVAVTLARDDDGRLAIAVADSGAGVPPHLVPRIFEAGFSTKPAGPAGRGVGLGLVRSLVHGAGGQLTLDDGRPTTFRVTLPSRRSA
ncbi:ATP-binding protein [Microbacterium sp. ARD31]|uniref:sensor histidine kinase n=1 Tax=Microbacterium sp. ARD31 TaxID=2962576 RepID=UPI002881AC51|nr:ATP-binding protein [Microbacterium sp. ARD31]MDT0186228.1 ATP-binding protein [Microbacterium sp. ARD31]